MGQQGVCPGERSKLSQGTAAARTNCDRSAAAVGSRRRRRQPAVSVSVGGRRSAAAVGGRESAVGGGRGQPRSGDSLLRDLRGAGRSGDRAPDRRGAGQGVRADGADAVHRRRGAAAVGPGRPPRGSHAGPADGVVAVDRPRRFGDRDARPARPADRRDGRAARRRRHADPPRAARALDDGRAGDRDRLGSARRHDGRRARPLGAGRSRRTPLPGQPACPTR